MEAFEAGGLQLIHICRPTWVDMTADMMKEMPPEGMQGMTADMMPPSYARNAMQGMDAQMMADDATTLYGMPPEAMGHGWK